MIYLREEKKGGKKGGGKGKAGGKVVGVTEGSEIWVWRVPEERDEGNREEEEDGEGLIFLFFCVQLFFSHSFFPFLFCVELQHGWEWMESPIRRKPVPNLTHSGK